MEIVSPSDQLLFATVRIETLTSIGALGTGTGFIFSYNTPNGEAPFIVTNKHVIADAEKGWLTLTQAHEGKPSIGLPYRLQIDDFQNIWYGHQDDEIDVAVAPLVPLLAHANQNGIQIFYKSIPSNAIPSGEIINSLSALEDVVFVGYPNGIWDQKNLLPIIRKGITATPFIVDFQGKKQFLIDASVFPGSSGSPVVLLNTGTYFEKIQQTTVVGNRFLFLGVVAEVYFRQDINEIKMVSVPTVDIPMAISKQMINLGVVFKASTIIETIKSFLVEKRVITDKADTEDKTISK